MRFTSTFIAIKLACSLLALPAHGQQPVPEKRVIAEPVVVPTGNGVPVMTDGIFTPGEWDDALLIALGKTLELHVKEYRGVVFIGLRGPAGIGPADLTGAHTLELAAWLKREAETELEPPCLSG